MVGVVWQQLTPRGIEAVRLVVGEQMLKSRRVQIHVLLDRQRVGRRIGAMAED